MKINNVLLAAFVLLFSSFGLKSEQESIEYDEMPLQDMEGEDGDMSSETTPRKVMPEEEMPTEEQSQPMEEMPQEEMPAEMTEEMEEVQ